MPKSKSRNREKIRKQHPQPPLELSHRLMERSRALSRHIWRWIVGASALLSLAAAVIFFLPKVTVGASGPFQPSATPPVTFVISNESVIPLENIKPRLGFCAISFNFGMTDDPKPP